MYRDHCCEPPAGAAGGAAGPQLSTGAGSMWLSPFAEAGVSGVRLPDIETGKLRVGGAGAPGRVRPVRGSGPYEPGQATGYAKLSPWRSPLFRRPPGSAKVVGPVIYRLERRVNATAV